VTEAGIAQIITAVGVLVAACSSVVGVVISARNGRRLEAVQHQTDGLVSVLGAAKLAQGTAEGTALGLQQGRDEAKP
jgi:hypothetical protein